MAKITCLLIGLLAGFSVSAQTIQTTRPRLILDAHTLAELRGKRDSGSGPGFDQYVKWRDAVLTYATTTGPINWASQAALLYALDPAGNLAWGQTACANGAYHATSGQYYSNYTNADSYRDYAHRAAWILDWAYNACTQAQRDAIKDTLITSYNYWKTNNHWDDHPYKAGNNYVTSEWMNMGSSLIAISGMSTGSLDPQAELTALWQTYKGSTRKCVVSQAASAPDETCFGGSWYEGHYYSNGDTKRLLLGFLDALSTGTNVDAWADLGTEIPRLASYFFTLVSPTGAAGAGGTLHVVPPLRDGYAVYWTKLGFTYREIMLRLLAHFVKSGDSANAGQVQWWLKNIQPYPDMAVGAASGDYLPPEFLWDRPQQGQINYQSTHSKNWVTPMALSARSAWATDATWVHFFANFNYGQHSHGDAGQFQIYRKGEWLTSEFGEYGTGLITDEVNNAFAHNTLILNNHGTHASAGRGGANVKSYFAPYPFSRLTRTPSGYRGECSADDAYCYVQADMGGDYQFVEGGGTTVHISPDVDYAYRDFLYLKPDLFVINDRWKFVPGLNATGMSTMFSQAGQPTVTGNRVSVPSAGGSQKLHVNVVTPSSPLIWVQEMDRWAVVGVEKIAGTYDVFLYFDNWVANGIAAGRALTVSGGTGAWANLNGQRTFAATVYPHKTHDTPYKDGIAYNGERWKITLSPAEYAALPAQFDTTQRIYADIGKAWENVSRTIVGATNASPIVVTTSVNHGWSNGDYIYISGATGNTAANGFRRIRNATANTFEITDWQGNDIAGNGTFAGATTVHRILRNKWSTRVFSGQYQNEESQMLVLEAADSSATPAAVATWSTPLLNIAQFSDYLAAGLKSHPAPDNFTYSFDGSRMVKHHLIGLEPGGFYYVDASAAGVIHVSRTFTPGWTQVTATPAGVLRMTTGATGQLLQSRIAATSSSKAVLVYGRRGLNANQTCLLELRRLSAPAIVVETGADAGGGQFREFVFGEATPLDVASGFQALVTCGSESSTVSFSTQQSAGATPLPVSLSLAAPAGATEVLVRYGNSPGMTGSVTQA